MLNNPLRTTSVNSVSTELESTQLSLHAVFEDEICKWENNELGCESAVG